MPFFITNLLFFVGIRIMRNIRLIKTKKAPEGAFLMFELLSGF